MNEITLKKEDIIKRLKAGELAAQDGYKPWEQLAADYINALRGLEATDDGQMYWTEAETACDLAAEGLARVQMKQGTKSMSEAAVINMLTEEFIADHGFSGKYEGDGEAFDLGYVIEVMFASHRDPEALFIHALGTAMLIEADLDFE